MKNIKTTIPVIVILLSFTVQFSFLIPVASAQYTENWEINVFNSDITIQQNGNVNITETIIADFTEEAHRGILRAIPYKYQTEGFIERNAELRFHSAVNEQGRSWEIETYRKGGYLNVEMRNLENELRNDVNTFIISFSAKNIINFFDTHDELYWNVNGTEWVVPANEVKATIRLPQNFTEEELMLTCFTGTYGEENAECTYSLDDPRTVTFRANRALMPYENLTIVVGLPKGTITLPTLFEKILWFLRENWGVFIAPLTLIAMLILWYLKGRDEKIFRDTIMPHYKPPEGLLPTETGVIIDEKIDPRDITSTIIDYAIKGYIKITEISKKKLIGEEKDYELELIKPFVTKKPFEKQILGAIFPLNTSGNKIKISELKNSFYKHIPEINKTVIKDLVKEEYFPHDPHLIRNTWLTIGSAILFGSFYLIALFSIATFIGIILSGLIIIIVGRYLPRRTKKGTETYYDLKGLYEYINTAEKDRMKFQEENNIMFEKLLPYAISFNLVRKWSKAFEDLIQNPPNWYYSSRPWSSENPFTMAYFADALDNMTNTTTTNLTSRPGSSGSGGAWSGGSGFSGGFSGGGFGGGGGRGF